MKRVQSIILVRIIWAQVRKAFCERFFYFSLLRNVAWEERVGNAIEISHSTWHCDEAVDMVAQPLGAHKKRCQYMHGLGPERERRLSDENLERNHRVGRHNGDGNYATIHCEICGRNYMLTAISLMIMKMTMATTDDRPAMARSTFHCVRWVHFNLSNRNGENNSHPWMKSIKIKCSNGARDCSTNGIGKHFSLCVWSECVCVCVCRVSRVVSVCWCFAFDVRSMRIRLKLAFYLTE